MALSSSKRAIAAVALSVICAALAGIAWVNRQGGMILSGAEVSHTGANDVRSTPRVEDFVLGNGLQVVAIPMVDAEETVLMVWYHVGAADDAPDKPGLAHYVEHVTFSALGSHDDKGGPEPVSPGGRTGVRPEAFTSHDYTAYYHVTRKSGLPAALEVEAARMDTLRVNEAAVRAEREAVIEERMHDVEDDPQALLEEKLQAVIFDGAGYGRPVVAELADANGVSAEDVRVFLDKWYSPSNAVLIVSGDFDASALPDLVETNFGQIEGRAAPRRERPLAAASVQQRVSVEASRARQGLWAMSCVAPSLATAGGRTVLSTQVLEEILAHRDRSQLVRSLVAEGEKAEAVAVEYDPNAVGQAVFSLQAVLARGADVSVLERGIAEELQELVLSGPSEEELFKARQNVRAALASAWVEPLDAATMLGSALVTGASLADIERRHELIAEIGPEDVLDATRRVFARNNCVTGTLRANDE